MAKRLNQIVSSIDRLRKDSLDVVGQANKIVSSGVQRLADHELEALKEACQSVSAALKSGNKSDSIVDNASRQLDMMHESVSQLIASAKDALNIVAETRTELTVLLNKNGTSPNVAETEINKVTASAKRAVADVKAAASDAKKKASQVTAQAKSSADRVAAAVKTDAIKVSQVVSADVKAVRKRVGSVLDIQTKPIVMKKPIVVTARPSENSRASRATSNAKQAATGAVNVAKTVASDAIASARNAASAVVDAVKNAG